MKNMLLLFALLFASFLSHAQSGESYGAPTQNVTRLTLLSPGLSFEKSLGLLTSVMVHAYIGPGVTYSNGQTTDTRFYLDPTVDLSYRYYYNAPRRSEADKHTTLNNMNHFAAVGELIYSKRPIGKSLESTEARFLKKAGVVWGMQRNFPSRISFDFYVGPGLLFGEAIHTDETGNYYKKNVTQFSPLIQLSLGFWINRKY